MLVIIEMLADKIPAVNHINDLIQTVIRPAAGAIAFAASAKVVTDIHPVLALAADCSWQGRCTLSRLGWCVPLVTATTGGTANITCQPSRKMSSSTVLSILAIVLPIIIGTLIVVLAAFII